MQISQTWVCYASRMHSGSRASRSRGKKCFAGRVNKIIVRLMTWLGKLESISYHA